MKMRPKPKRQKRGVFIILASVMLVVILLGIYSTLNLFSLKQTHFKEPECTTTVQAISSDYENALEGSLANITTYLFKNIIEERETTSESLEKSSNSFLNNWHMNTITRYSGNSINISMPFDYEKNVKIDWSNIFSGHSRINGSIVFDINNSGLYGFKNEHTAVLNFTINNSSITQTGSGIAFNMTVIREGGYPVDDLMPSNVAVMAYQQGGFTLVNSTLISLIYYDGGKYSVTFEDEGVERFRVFVTDKRGIVAGTADEEGESKVIVKYDKYYVKEIKIKMDNSQKKARATVTVLRHFQNGTEIPLQNARVYGHWWGIADSQIQGVPNFPVTDSNGQATFVLDNNALIDIDENDFKFLEGTLYFTVDYIYSDDSGMKYSSGQLNEPATCSIEKGSQDENTVTFDFIP